jgi:hypothetical protein
MHGGREIADCRFSHAYLRIPDNKYARYAWKTDTLTPATLTDESVPSRLLTELLEIEIINQGVDILKFKHVQTHLDLLRQRN